MEEKTEPSAIEERRMIIKLKFPFGVFVHVWSVQKVSELLK
jgi:hypothetical protein